MKSILLIDIGAGPLPVVTPVPARQSAWFPVLHVAPPLPTPGGVTTSPVADGILVEWADSGIAGAVYVVSRAPAEAGPYAIVHRTTGLRYLHTDNTGEVSWFRVTVDLNGRESVPSIPVEDAPVDVSAGIAQSDQAAADALAAALAADAKAAQEIIDRQAADAILAAEAAVLRSQVGDILQADVHDPATAYPDGDLVQFGDPAKLYRALQDVPVGIAISNTAYWEVIGNYASLGEAVSANVALSMATASDLEAVSQTVTRHEVRMPTGTDTLANEGRVVTAEQAAASATGAVASDLDLLEIKVNDPDTGLAAKASIIQHNQVKGRIDNTGGGRSIEQVASSLVLVENELPGKASTAAFNSLDTYTRQTLAGEVQANATNISGVKAEAEAPFSPVLGWQFIETQEGFTAVNSTVANWPRTIDNGAAAITATTEDPIFISPVISVLGRTAGKVRAFVRRRSGTGGWEGLLFWSTTSHGFVAEHFSVGDIVPGADFVVVEWDLSGNADWRGSTITGLRFDFGTGTVGSIVDVQWIAIGGDGPAAGAAVTQALRADVDSVTGKVNASHSVVLDVNGHVSGTRSENDGTKSSFSILATVFRVISAISGMGMEWLDGYLRIWRGSGQVILGFNFGPGDVLLWAGPNVGAAGANKANALFYIDTAGTGYFAGRVLQGVIRSFGSSTDVGNAITTAVATASNGKPVAVKFELLRTTFQAYNGTSATITMGGGQTYVDVSIQRRYGTGAYAEIATQRVFGNVEWFSEPGAGAWIQHRLQNIVQATDVADTRERQYRAVLTNMTFQPHTVANPGTTPAAVTNQYTAVESLE